MILLAYLVMCLIFGTTFLAIKIGIDAGALPFLSAAVRFLAAGGILMLYCVWRGTARFSILWRRETLLTGFLLTFGTFSTLYWAEQYVESGLAAVLSATGPIMILLLQALLLKQRASSKSVAGCVIGFAGVILLMLPGLTLNVNRWWVLGCILVLIGELSYSSGALYSKKTMHRFHDTSPIALNAAQMLWGGILLLSLSLGTEHPGLSLPSGKAVGALLYLTIAGSMIGHTLFYWLVSKTNPVFPATWLYISPLIAMGLGIMLYNESFSWLTAAGAAVVLMGIILVNADALRALLTRSRKPAIAQSHSPAQAAKQPAN